MNPPSIGVVCGAGPYAGLDLAQKIRLNTYALLDQDHLPVLLHSLPAMLPDRTEYLLGQVEENPGHSFSKIIQGLEEVGATAIGIPCNTAHAPPIFDIIGRNMENRGSKATLINMIEEAGAVWTQHFPTLRKIGVLGTTGTARTGLYRKEIIRRGGEPILLPEEVQHDVHAAIYNVEFGLKAGPVPVDPRSRALLEKGAKQLIEQGAELIVLGCTEIPLALVETSLFGVPLVDPTTALARALIRANQPDKLKPFNLLNSPKTK